MDFQNETESNRSDNKATFYDKLCAIKYKIALISFIILVVCYMFSSVIIDHIYLTALTAAINEDKNLISINIEKMNLKSSDSLAVLTTGINSSKAPNSSSTESSFSEYADPTEYYPTEYNYTDTSE